MFITCCWNDRMHVFTEVCASKPLTLPLTRLNTELLGHLRGHTRLSLSTKYCMLVHHANKAITSVMPPLVDNTQQGNSYHWKAGRCAVTIDTKSLVY